MGSVTYLWQRRRLLALMVRQDFKWSYGKYRLGFVWTLGEPFLMALLMFTVFTFIFPGGRGVGLQPFIVFLILGLYPFGWLSQSLRLGPKSFDRYGDMLETSPLPPVVWPLRSVLLGFVEFMTSVPVIVFFVLVTGAGFGWGVLLFPLGVLLQFALCLGVAMLGAGLSLRWRDVEVFMPMVSRALFWLSPVLWYQKALPDSIPGWLLYINPFYCVLDLFRASVWPTESLSHLGYDAISAGVLCAVVLAGALVLKSANAAARRLA